MNVQLVNRKLISTYGQKRTIGSWVTSLVSKAPHVLLKSADSPVAVLLLPVVLLIQLSINSATKSSYRTHALNQQFVRENTQTIDCRCFHSKDNWAERNWFTSVTSRERKFRGREIAFGPNKHQDAARRMLMLT